MTDLPVRPSRHHLWRITRRALSKSWDDSIFSESAQAAFWSALSLPPLLLGMLGSLAYIAPLFGPDTLHTIEDRLVSTAGSLFSSNVVNEIIQPTVSDIVAGARGEVVSLGFVISLWAGSSAVSAFVDSVVEAPNGAHFTVNEPDYRRDEKFQRHYAEAAASEETWAEFVSTYLSGSEADYQAAVQKFKQAQA